MIFCISISQCTTIVRANILDTVYLILDEGNNYECLVHFRRERYVWNKLIIRANEMIHRSRLILKGVFLVGFQSGF